MNQGSRNEGQRVLLAVLSRLFGPAVSRAGGDILSSSTGSDLAGLNGRTLV